MKSPNLRDNSVTTLRRYTDLPALLYMLRNKKITLLNPASWDDRNDSHYLHLYKEKKDLGSALALCFTEAGETYHHWRVFSSGSTGVCIRFNKDILLENLTSHNALRAGPAQYKMMSHMRNASLAVEDLPFLKRYAFRDEREFRIIYDSKRSLNFKDFPLALECIDRITINPWINERLADALWDTIRGLKDCENLKVGQSSLINNNEWEKSGSKAT